MGWHLCVGAPHCQVSEPLVGLFPCGRISSDGHFLSFLSLRWDSIHVLTLQLSNPFCRRINIGLVSLHASYEQDTLSEPAVSLRTMLTFATWSSSGTEFLIKKLFHDDIFIDVLVYLIFYFGTNVLVLGKQRDNFLSPSQSLKKDVTKISSES